MCSFSQKENKIIPPSCSIFQHHSIAIANAVTIPQQNTNNGSHTILASIFHLLMWILVTIQSHILVQYHPTTARSCTSPWSTKPYCIINILSGKTTQRIYFPSSDWLEIDSMWSMDHLWYWIESRSPSRKGRLTLRRRKGNKWKYRIIMGSRD